MKELLSPATQDRLTRIQTTPELFTPNEFVLSELGKKSLVMVVSPCSGGKGYIIDQTVSRDPSFRKSRSLTTRPPRSDDTPETVRYIGWTDEGINDFCQMIEQGNYVNYVFHPKTGEIYGTALQDHPGEYNLLPTLTGGITRLEALPFRGTTTIGLAPEPDQWQPWFDKREFKDEADRTARIGEGITSLQWLLDRPDVSIVTNMPDLDVVKSIQHIVKTGSVVRDEATAVSLLRRIESLA